MPDNEEFWKGKHYSFFQNRECEFFPCHECEKPEDFNCLFCYCPLYALGTRCGGSFRITEKGVKDCTFCTFPHLKDNYGAVTGKFREIMEIVRQSYTDQSDKGGSR